ncbi:dienelactone hydrolase family protein [Aeromonas enteropelogenes]|uniref:dienelactone hydrolase family protein n=1 Tax=Aeromonas enteropelogenes TaxID=29489 RepID=UPI00191E04C9|nr:alpha/beta fold hydrolase [Aeromonas enteropelogenes]MBL0520891.1 dienelactone hydrolase family protein [Aeromonas enteropelogenes]
MKGIYALMAALLAAPLWAASLTYQVAGSDFEGYQTRGRDGGPIILLIHDWDGLTDYEIKRSEMLGNLGYNVFAVDLFGKGVRPATIEARREATGALYQDRARMRQLLEGGLAAARQALGEGPVAVLGYCFGGAAALEMARSGSPLAGVVSVHGGLATPPDQDYGKTRAALLIQHGSADVSVSLQEFAALAEQLEKAGVRHEMTTYSGAPHAFSVFGGDRYHQEADAKSWQRLVGWLAEVTGRAG